MHRADLAEKPSAAILKHVDVTAERLFEHRPYITKRYHGCL